MDDKMTATYNIPHRLVVFKPDRWEDDRYSKYSSQVSIFKNQINDKMTATQNIPQKLVLL